MKSGDEMFARMVRRAMEILGETDLANYMPGFESFMARASADIVGMVVSGDIMIYDGEIQMIAGPPLRNMELSGNGMAVWVVNTVDDYSDQQCRWCGSVYGSADPGGQHRLCKRCYKGGPPEL